MHILTNWTQLNKVMWHADFNISCKHWSLQYPSSGDKSHNPLEEGTANTWWMGEVTGVRGSSTSTEMGSGADSPEGARWAAWWRSEGWDGAWLWLCVCWRMFRHSPRQLRVAADVALSNNRSWSRQERGPLVGSESMEWTRFFCWPSAWDITWGTKVMRILINSIRKRPWDKEQQHVSLSRSHKKKWTNTEHTTVQRNHCDKDGWVNCKNRALPSNVCEF